MAVGGGVNDGDLAAGGAAPVSSAVGNPAAARAASGYRRQRLAAENLSAAGLYRHGGAAGMADGR